MRLIDADALHDQYLHKMSELVKSTTIENVSLESLSLLCGSVLVSEAPTVPYDMKWNPECADCSPECIEDCIECRKRG